MTYYSLLPVKSWKQVDGYTVMHMMGYERNWVLSSFQDAIGHGFDIHTLIFLCEEHIKLWSTNDDINKILRYLLWVRKNDYPHLTFKDNEKLNELLGTWSEEE